MYKFWQKNQSAFSLTEMVLVVAIIAILLGIFMPAFSRLFFRNNLDSAKEAIKTELYRAQASARASENDSNWGIYLNNGNLILFSGSSYATRNSNYDFLEKLAGNPNFSGLTEVVFNKSSGLPSTSGTIIISDAGLSKEIVISPSGLIN